MKTVDVPPLVEDAFDEAATRYTPSLLSHENLEAILVQRHALAQKLVELVQESVVSKSLSQQSKELVSDRVSQIAAESWRDVWQELVGDRPEFQIPLRLLNAVIEYKTAPDDPRVFLSLAIEERKILQQLLGVSAKAKA